jgi:hypothetical protein
LTNNEDLVLNENDEISLIDTLCPPDKEGVKHCVFEALAGKPDGSTIDKKLTLEWTNENIEDPTKTITKKINIELWDTPKVENKDGEMEDVKECLDFGSRRRRFRRFRRFRFNLR